MDNNTIVTIAIGGLIAAALLAGITCWLLAKLKGNLELHIPKHWLEPKESLQGRLRVTAKKPFRANHITITLTCSMTHRGGTNKGSSQPLILHQEVIPLSKERQFNANQFQDYTFTFTLPETLPSPHEALEKYAKEHLGKFAGGLVEVATAFTRYYVTWWLDVTVDAEGIDLHKRSKVMVNLKPETAQFG